MSEMFTAIIRILIFVKLNHIFVSFQRHIKASYFLRGVFTDVFYLGEENVKISEACVYHRPYLRRLTKNPFKKTIDIETKEPEVQKCKLIS